MTFNLAQIEITNRCNLNCNFCFRKHMNRYQSDMRLSTFIRSLIICKRMNIPEVWLHNWGEPTLHPHLDYFVGEASFLFKVGFVSNGILINYGKLESLKKHSLTYLDLSLNMETPKTALPHLLEIYKYANDLGIDCRFRSVVNNLAEYDYLNGLFCGYKIRWQRAMIRKMDKSREEDCQAVDKVFVILFDGRVVPCCHCADAEIIYGRIKDNDIIESIEAGIEGVHRHHKFGFCKNCFEIEEELPIRKKL